MIKNIRMEVEKGEILTLIGPNGAGKSTIFKSITRQLAILGGSVWVDGQEEPGVREELAENRRWS